MDPLDFQPMAWLALAAAGGFLIGSIPFALIVTRLAGHGDIRKIGSGNIGATNVLRTGSRGLAALTLILDAGKGALAVLAASAVLSRPADAEPSHLPMLIAGGFAILGHVFTPWLRFRGGKGVATTFGVLLAVFPMVGGLSLLGWIVTAGITRKSSLAAAAAMLVAPPAAWLLAEGATAILALLASGLVLVRHRENFRRLLAGNEPPIGAARD